MYHEEKIINGVLCYRTTPDSEFREYTKEQLTTIFIEMQRFEKEVEKLKNRLRAINRVATDYTIEYNYDGEIIQKSKSLI